MDFRDWLNDDYYNLLGVTLMSTPDEINKAYRSKAKNCHPDIFPLNSIERYQAEQKFKKILEARDTLLDSEKRNEYDNERQFMQDSYLAAMSNGYYSQPEKYTDRDYNTSCRNELKKTRAENLGRAIINASNHKNTKDYWNNKVSAKEKVYSYKKQEARRYYSLCLKALNRFDFNRALIYFQSANHLDPGLQMPSALWTEISRVKYNI
jgi:curved DNA-binding protein CbpA